MHDQDLHNFHSSRNVIELIRSKQNLVGMARNTHTMGKYVHVSRKTRMEDSLGDLGVVGRMSLNRMLSIV